MVYKHSTILISFAFCIFVVLASSQSENDASKKPEETRVGLQSY